MLDFFRQYQRYFFLVITVVIIISFSFFGTYSTLGSNQWREQIAFKAVNGKEIPRLDVDEMAAFIGTDNEDKILFGGAWGPNFLNDGVIRKDFLETGLAEELVVAYREDLQEELDKRLMKEKKYTLYAHPQAPFVGVKSVWNYFVPHMYTYFDALQGSNSGADLDAFNNRVKLYLAEKQIPAPMLRQVLYYQQQQFSWLKPDQRLDRTDLSLFGYHSLEDWFSPQFTRLVSEFIINAAILAQEQGYVVSKDEVLMDLVKNTQVSYQQNLKNPNLGVTSPEEYFSEQLRRLNMDQARAIKIWEQVLLFRRFFHDAGANALVDGMMSQTMDRFGNDSVTVDLYQLPSSLHLANFDDLQKFESYLYAVVKQDKSNPLAVPSELLSVTEVEKRYPELVQRSYVLDVAQVNQKTLETKIGLRDMWNWEMDERNWAVLTKQFPILGIQPGQTREERFEALEGLEQVTRASVDAFARNAIIKEHPEWVLHSLDAEKPKRMLVNIRNEGGEIPFSGLDDLQKRKEFIQLLDNATLGQAVPSDSPLNHYTADDKGYYRISVIERSGNPEIVSFAEARADGTLDAVRDRILEKHYLIVRQKDPAVYQNEKKEWKSFRDVRNFVADDFFKRVMTDLESVQKKTLNENEAQVMSKDQIASLRLYTHLDGVKAKLTRGVTDSNQLTIDALDSKEKKNEDDRGTTLAARPAAVDQWKVEKKAVILNRQQPNASLDIEKVFVLPVNEWSSIHVMPSGDLSFFQIKEKGLVSDQKALIAQQTRDLQAVLSDEAQRHLMQQVVKTLKDKNALSLAYMKAAVEDQPTGYPAEMSE